MKKENAAAVLNKLIEASQRLAEVVPILNDEPDDGGRKAFSIKVGRILYDVYEQLMAPIVIEHPELRPDEMPVPPKGPAG